MSNKLLFSGHNTFTCKQYWLHKGYEFVKDQKNFNEENAVVDLGVGKNMVNAIRYWLRSFGLVDEKDSLTILAKKIFDRNGWDPYLEDIGSLWILHYLLIKSNRASIYNLVFNDFRKERIDFTKTQLLNFLKELVLKTITRILQNLPSPAMQTFSYEPIYHPKKIVKPRLRWRKTILVF